MAEKRKPGSGTVRLRADGRWEGRVVVGRDEKGYPKTKNVLAKTKSECIEKLKKLKVECAAAKPKKLSPGITFGAWIDYWYQTWVKGTIRPATQANYEGTIYKHIIPELGKIPLNKLTQSDLQQFYTRMKTGGRLRRTEYFGKGLSDRTVRCCHANCRAALEKAVAEGLIKTNPAVGCKLSPKKTREMQVLTREEMQRFLIQAKEEGFYELFALELATGLRRGELLALQWDDVNFRTGELRVDKQIFRVDGKLTVSAPKTKASARTVILPPPVLNVLREYKEASMSRWLFPSPRKDDAPLDPAWCRKKLQIILEHAQCKQVRFHDLRHTFATEALAHGMDVKTLSAVIGHVSAATTLDVYTHVTDDMQKRAADSIDRGIGKAEPAQETAPALSRKNSVQTFQPYKGTRRKPGTGCVSQINDHLWEGRYSPVWPDGKKHARNVYAHDPEECERLLAELIVQMKREIAGEKERQKEKGKPRKGRKGKKKTVKN